MLFNLRKMFRKKKSNIIKGTVYLKGGRVFDTHFSVDTAFSPTDLTNKVLHLLVGKRTKLFVQGDSILAIEINK